MECFTEVNKVELLEKISELFKKFGLRSTSMDEIAMHLKMSKKTLYQMFDNKTDIVEQISILRQKKLFDIEESKNRILKQENLLEQFYIGMQHMAHSLDSFKTNNHYDIKKYYPELYEKYVRHFDEQSVLFFKEFIKICIQKGIFKDLPQYQLRTYLLMRTLSTLTDPEYQTDETFTNGEMAIGLFDTYIRSVATVKGLQQWEHILQNPPKIDFSDSL